MGKYQFSLPMYSVYIKSYRWWPAESIACEQIEFRVHSSYYLARDSNSNGKMLITNIHIE